MVNLTEKESLIKDYAAELEYALKQKEEGVIVIPSSQCGGEREMTIDEYIEMWYIGLIGLRTAKNIERFCY